jgi:hypothetical protein
MAASARIVLVVAGALVALGGLALGAESQREVFLEPDLDAADLGGAAGNLVLLTAVLVGVGAALAAATLSTAPLRRRIPLAAALVPAAYALAVVVQSAFPNNVGLVEARRAFIAWSLWPAQVDAVPSLFLPVLAIALGALLAVGWCLRALLVPSAAQDTPEAALHRQAAATLLAGPFLAVAACGNLRLLLLLPDEPGLGPYLVVLPLAALACLALLGLLAAKTWQLGRVVRNPRLAAYVQESWTALGRAESALLAALAALAVGASLLPAEDLGNALFGGSFAVTLRGHTQLLVLLAIPLLPAWLAHRPTTRLLERLPARAGTLETGTHPSAIATLTAAGSMVVLAAATTAWAEGALWAWLAAFVPAVAVASVRLQAGRAAPVLLGAGYLLWAVGNTIIADYDGDLITPRDPPGFLALWRTAGAVVAAVAVARMAWASAAERRASLAMPMAVGLAACLAAVALVELPLTTWSVPRSGGSAIAVGSVLASLDAPVRIVLHLVAAGLSATAAVLAAMLLRPEWFKSPRRPLAAPVRRKGPAPAPWPAS